MNAIRGARRGRAAITVPRASGFLASLLLAGCTVVGPDYEAPATNPPAAWSDAPRAGLVSGPADHAAWWRRFEDPLLDQLVTRAATSNLDLREALARVAESRALRGGAAAARYARIDGAVGFTRTAQSENTPFGAFVPDSDEYSARLDATWEVDLFGRVRRSIEAADADLEASVEGARDALVTVVAEVALAYVDLRSFQRRLSIALANLALQQQTLALVEGRFEAGIVGEGDVAQARTNVESTRARTSTFEIGARSAENRLAVLLGEAPGALGTLLRTESGIPSPPAAIALGVPADVLRRRPDVRRAERELAAETARIGIAEAELYPRLTLAGNLGLAAQKAGDLAEGSSVAYGFGPTLRWNVFDAGRLRELVGAQEARATAALARHERTVLVALEEAENAMTGFAAEQSRRAALVAAADAARRAVVFARTQYGEGLSDFQAVLIPERTLADVEDQLAATEAAVAMQAVRLFKALGG